MEKKLRAIVDKLLIITRLRGIVTAVRTLYQIEFVDGHFISSTLYQSIDKDKNPLPWFSYPFIKYLDSLNLKSKTIFEYGSGNSSYYWSSVAKKLITVEHDAEWYSKVSNNLSILKNVEIRLAKTKKNYVNSVKIPRKIFDIIVIDGEWREECAKIAVDCLSTGGVIILDNSDWFPTIRKFLKVKGFHRIDFRGFAPQNPYQSTTSIFFRTYNLS